MSRRYSIDYEVAADYAFAAIAKAAQKVRDGVRLDRWVSAVELAPGWWKVTLRVSEDS